MLRALPDRQRQTRLLLVPVSFQIDSSPLSRVDPNTCFANASGRFALLSRRSLRASEQKILQNRVAGDLKFLGGSVEIHLPFVQISNVVGKVKRALHIVRHHNAGNMEALLQTPDQSIDAVRNDWVETGGRFIIQNTGGD